MGLIYNATEQFVHELWTSVKMNGFYFILKVPKMNLKYF